MVVSPKCWVRGCGWSRAAEGGLTPCVPFSLRETGLKSREKGKNVGNAEPARAAAM